MPKSSNTNRRTSKKKKLEVLQKLTPLNLSRVVRVAMIVIVLCFVWAVIRNDSYYWTNPSSTEEAIKHTFEQVRSAPGKQVYSDITNAGCDTGSSVGLATVVHCDFIAYKYFVNKGDIEADLRSIDSVLIGNDWKRNLPSNQTWNSSERTMSDSKVSSFYQKNNSRSIASVGYYKGVSQNNDYALQELVESKKIPVPGPEEYIYGIRITDTYWACRDQSILKLPCVVPPWYSKS